MTSENEAAMLRQYLSGRDVPCPQCEYNLRDLTGTRCPECGEELVLRLQLDEPRQAAALAGLIALAAGAGMNFLLLGYWVIAVTFMGRGGSGSDRWWNRFVGINAGGLLVVGCCLAVWLGAWRKIRRLRTASRWTLAVGCALLSLADLVIFTKYIR
jgi:hypothetical protein